MPPYMAAATLSACPSRAAARASSLSASGDRRPTLAPSSSPATMAAALLPSPRAAGIMLLTSIRQAPLPVAAPDRRARRPSRKARMSRFWSGSASRRGPPRRGHSSTIPASSPAYSSARSFRLRAAAKQSKPLPRLAVLAGTSTEASGRHARGEYAAQAELRPRTGRSPAQPPRGGGSSHQVVVDQASRLHEGVARWWGQRS